MGELVDCRRELVTLARTYQVLQSRGQPRQTVAAKSPPGLAVSRLTDSPPSLFNMQQ